MRGGGIVPIGACRSALPDRKARPLDDADIARGGTHDFRKPCHVPDRHLTALLAHNALLLKILHLARHRLAVCPDAAGEVAGDVGDVLDAVAQPGW